jgi:hypothetical protein
MDGDFLINLTCLARITISNAGIILLQAEQYPVLPNSLK